MIITKRTPPYKGGKPKSFVLLWVEEDTMIKGTPRTQPYFFVPTKKELENSVEKQEGK